MNIKKYLPIGVKKAVCEKIVANSLVKKDGMLFEDFIAKKIALYLTICQFYTDLDMEQIDYDIMHENGTMDKIIKEIPDSELSFYEDIIDCMIKQEVETYNSIGAVFSRNFQTLVGKIPDEKGIKSIMSEILKQINKLKPDKIEILKGIFGGQTKSE